VFGGRDDVRGLPLCLGDQPLGLALALSDPLIAQAADENLDSGGLHGLPGWILLKMRGTCPQIDLLFRFFGRHVLTSSGWQS
jgi:hypothetical protein